MKRIKYLITSFAAASLFFGVSSCDSFETELTENPSVLAPNEASLKLYFNALQIRVASVFEQASLIGMDATRMTHMSGSSNYQSNFTPEGGNNLWTTAYAGFLADSKALKELAAEKGHGHYQAVAQIMDAYVYCRLVDLFGDIPTPASGALEGINGLNPERTDDAAVYAASKASLQDALTKLAAASPAIESDLYYGGNMGNWARLANTLLLQIAVQTRLVNTNAQAEIQAILTANNYITDNSQNFKFQYSATATNPDSRHPRFVESYAQGTPTEYLGNYFMWLTTQSKPAAANETRGSFYFYRKTLNSPSSTTESGCFGTTAPAHYTGVPLNQYSYCVAGNGYNGKDHGDASPAPNDGAIVTIMGQYPAGGLRDTGAPAAISATSGQGGAGISPMITASYVHFLIAEAQLTVFNNSGNARTSMRTAIDRSMELVTGSVNGTYTNWVSTNRYDAASNDAGRLNVIMTEAYLSLWGNGIEAYNNFRRTGLPVMQPSLSPSPGSFVNLMFYPANHVNLNTSVSQRPSVSEKVFWAAPTTFNLDY